MKNLLFKMDSSHFFPIMMSEQWINGLEEKLQEKV